MKLEDLETLAKSATPGPWDSCTWDPMEVSHITVGGPYRDGACLPMRDLPRTPENARYIAAASPDVILSLLARLKRAEAVCEAARTIGALGCQCRYQDHTADCPMARVAKALSTLDGGNDADG